MARITLSSAHGPLGQLTDFITSYLGKGCPLYIDGPFQAVLPLVEETGHKPILWGSR